MTGVSGLDRRQFLGALSIGAAAIALPQRYPCADGGTKRLAGVFPIGFTPVNAQNEVDYRRAGFAGAILQARRRARSGVATDRQWMDNAERRGKDARCGDHHLRRPRRYNGDRDRRAESHGGFQGNRALCQASGEAWCGCHYLYRSAGRDGCLRNCCSSISGSER